jgi:hypothetical protein
MKFTARENTNCTVLNISKYCGNVWWSGEGIPHILKLLYSWQAFL